MPQPPKKAAPRRIAAQRSRVKPETVRDRPKGQLTGRIHRLTEAEAANYRVQFRNLARTDRRFGRTLILALLTMACNFLFVYWMIFDPARWPQMAHHWWPDVGTRIVFGSLAFLEVMRLINTISLSLATVLARDPVPVMPERGTRVALRFTFVPSSESIVRLEQTLRAAKTIIHDGCLDIWVLDEGDSDEVKNLVARLNQTCSGWTVYYFTRKNIAAWNTRKGFFKTKTKGGNLNACRDFWRQEGFVYKYTLGLDPDHTPDETFALRILGYLRDPNIAFVVGPQVYENALANPLARAAESAQFAFHAIIQRAANFWGVPMLVGTSYAIRMTALDQIGGIADSVTEDMKTGLEMHRRRNPLTGKKWRSVYTPDVLAFGEGPSDWGGLFSQQSRWARGTFEILLKDMWKYVFGLATTPGRLFHYLLIVTFFPSVALWWLLGANVMVMTALGAGSINITPIIWAAFYCWLVVFQMKTYFSHRVYNVSPYEHPESRGASGMLIGVLMSPVYAGALVAALFRRSAKFVVTPKGEKAAGDRLYVFRLHLFWVIVFAAVIGLLAWNGRLGTINLLWPVLGIVTCLMPLLGWRLMVADVRRMARTVMPSGAAGISHGSLTNEPSPDDSPTQELPVLARV